MNTGMTSFMDGFGDPRGEGSVYNQVARFQSAGSIKDQSGSDVPVFKDPRLNVFADVNQFMYTFKTPETWVAAPLLSVIVPLVYPNATFAPGGASLQDNGFGLGDIVFGPYLQFKPVMSGHRPVFAQRVELNVQAPTGKYDPTKQINPGCYVRTF
ncbi:MAG TPA: transporter [Polyangiaceae bacterium]|nr:transporter [Polyangiaceae bacterium]